MIYIDSSVVLAYLLTEDRVPPSSLWKEPLVSSRLLHFEVWTRIHRKGLKDSHSQLVELLLKRIDVVEMVLPVLSRALDPFPNPIRTLDALHLASAHFLRTRRKSIVIASYDDRLVDAAQQMGFPIADL